MAKKGSDDKKGKRPPSKSKHKKMQVWKAYQVSGSSLVRKKESCPRCGSGTFLAQHKNRKTCGKCGYSESATKQE